MFISLVYVVGNWNVFHLKIYRFLKLTLIMLYRTRSRKMIAVWNICTCLEDFLHSNCITICIRYLLLRCSNWS